MSLRQYLNPKMVVMGPDATAHEAARAMIDHQIGAVVVVHDGRVVGIVTDRDLVLDVVANAANPIEVRVGSVMRPNVTTIDVGATAGDAVALMRTNACRRLPIVENGRVAGIVTLDDLLLERALSPEEIAGVVASQLELAKGWSLRNREREGKGSPPTEIGRHARLRRRHGSRAGSTYAHWLDEIQAATGLKTRQDAETAALIVLEGICRRIPPPEAKHVLPQLPSVLREELVSCLEGAPDKSITKDALEAELRHELHLGQLDAGVLLASICNVIFGTLSPSLSGAVRTSMPAELENLVAHT